MSIQVTGKFDGQKQQAFLRRLIELLSNGINSGLWERIARWMRGIVTMQFRNQGGSYGREKWPSIAPSLWGRIRKSSDGVPVGRYSEGTLPLRASGKYRESFGVIRQYPRNLTWGSKHKKADKIPYGGWNQGKANAMARYTPRYAMPDQADTQFVAELGREQRGWLEASIKAAMLGGT